VNYDALYRENLDYFGKPFPELMEWFKSRNQRGKVLDVGCGQGRDALPLVDMGYDVHAIDISKEAIRQLRILSGLAGKPEAEPGIRQGVKSQVAKGVLTCEVTDVMSLKNLGGYDIILMDGFFHFYDHDRLRDLEIIKKISDSKSPDALLIYCFTDRPEAIKNFRELMDPSRIHEEISLKYKHIDPVSEWRFETSYRVAIAS